MRIIALRTRRRRRALVVSLSGCVVLLATALLFGQRAPDHKAVRTVALGQQSQCATQQDLANLAAGVDTSASDDLPLLPGDRQRGANVDLWPIETTANYVSRADVVAVLRVEGRDLPVLPTSPGGSPDGNPMQASQVDAVAVAPGPPLNDATLSIVRPTRFSVDRAIKGSLGPCVAFNVPGGTVGSLHLTTNIFPSRLNIGDRVLMIGGGLGPSMAAAIMLPVDDHGMTRLPFGGRETTNVDTWNPLS